MNTANAAYQIPDYYLTELKGKVTRMSNRCKKLGLAPIEMREVHVSERVCYRYSEYAGRTVRYILPCTWVEVAGPAPVVEGWLFLARVEHTEAGNIVSQPSTGELGPSYDLTSYRTAKNVCDHCHAKRKRIDTFLLRSPEGEIKQIGRNCLADFLRCADVEVAVGILTLIEEYQARSCGGGGGDEDEGWGGGRWIQVPSMGHFLACAVQSTRKDGFKPSKAEGATKERAMFLAGPPPEGDSDADRANRADWIKNQPTTDDVQKGVACSDWLLANTDQTDYMHNMRVAIQLPSISERHAGLIASLPSTYDRAMGREGVKKAERAATSNSAFQGEIKKREVWTLTVVRQASWESDFGSVRLNIMADAAGNVFAWKQTGGGDALVIGKTYEIKGTVKKHDEYKGTKQTQLNRCVVQKEVLL